MYVMVEKTPRAFNLRLVRNDDVLEDIRDQGALDRLLVNIDELYTDFRRVLFFSSHCGYCSLRASNKTLNMVGIFFPPLPRRNLSTETISVARLRNQTTGKPGAQGSQRFRR